MSAQLQHLCDLYGQNQLYGSQSAVLQMRAGWAQGQAANLNYIAAQQQDNAFAGMSIGMLANAMPARWGTPAQLKLDRALEIAADVRARHPEMQVQRRTRAEV
jgi:hypothetical protein